MIKKPITYEDYHGNTITEDFYFNLTKLEMMEMEIDFEGGLSAHIERLTQTTAGAEAYHLFKDIVLKAYGEKSDDGKLFVKIDDNGAPLSRKFEMSPALAELIFSFLKNGNEAADFVRGVLPAKLVAEAEQEAKTEESGSESKDAAPARTFESYSREELLNMSKEEFDKLIPASTKDMNRAQLEVAMQRSSRS